MLKLVLSIYDSTSGCTVDFTRNISSVGLGDQIGAWSSNRYCSIMLGNVNLLWVENGSNAILEMKFLVTLSLGKLVVVLL